MATAEQIRIYKRLCAQLVKVDSDVKIGALIDATSGESLPSLPSESDVCHALYNSISDSKLEEEMVPDRLLWPWLRESAPIVLRYVETHARSAVYWMKNAKRLEADLAKHEHTETRAAAAEDFARDVLADLTKRLDDMSERLFELERGVNEKAAENG